MSVRSAARLRTLEHGLKAAGNKGGGMVVSLPCAVDASSSGLEVQGGQSGDLRGPAALARSRNYAETHVGDLFRTADCSDRVWTRGDGRRRRRQRFRDLKKAVAEYKDKNAGK